MKRSVRSAALLVPSLAGLGLCFFYPLVYIIAASLKKDPFSGGGAFWGNYKTLFKNEYFQNALKNSLLFTLVAVFSAMALSVAVSCMIYEKAKKAPLLRSLFVIPFLMPSSLLVSVWSTLFPNAAPFFSLCVLFVIKNSGIVIMLLSSALCRVSDDIRAAAAIDGACGVRLFTSVLLPAVSPSLLFTFILTLSSSTGIYRESYLLFGEYPGQSVYMIQNYLNNHFMKLNYHYVAAGAAVFTAVVMILAICAMRLERRLGCE